MSKKIYVASPLGFSEAGRYWMHRELLPKIKSVGLEILDPWDSPANKVFETILKMPIGEERVKLLADLDKQCGLHNEELIDRADGIFAILDGTDVDSGTASEIGYGSSRMIPIIGYRGDFRKCSDNEGSIVNLQVEHFIKKTGGYIITDVRDIEPACYQTFINNILYAN